MTEIETINDQLVGTQAGEVVVLMPKPRMTKTEALRHAAWLVCVADESDDGRSEFDAVLHAIRQT